MWQHYHLLACGVRLCCLHCSVCSTHRVGQNRIITPYMAVYLVISLPKLMYINVYIWFWPTLSMQPWACALGVSASVHQKAWGGGCGVRLCCLRCFQGWPEPYIYGVYTVFLAGKSSNIRCIYTVLANPSCFVCCMQPLACALGASASVHQKAWGGGCA